MGAWSVMPEVWPLSQGDATTALTGSGARLAWKILENVGGRVLQLEMR